MEFIEIYKAESEIDANIAKGYLESHGLRSFVEPGNEVTLHGYASGPNKTCWVVVRKKDAEVASQLIRERENQRSADTKIDRVKRARGSTWMSLTIFAVGTFFVSVPFAFYTTTIADEGEVAAVRYGYSLLSLSIPIATLIAIFLGRRSFRWFILPFIPLALLVVFAVIFKK